MWLLRWSLFKIHVEPKCGRCYFYKYQVRAIHQCAVHASEHTDLPVAFWGFLFALVGLPSVLAILEYSCQQERH